MKKAVFIYAFALLSALGCARPALVAPARSVPTFDDNLISTMVVQTAEAEGLSAANGGHPAAVPTLLPVAVVVPPPINAAAPAVCPEVDETLEARMIELINLERAKAGLAALSPQSRLTITARLHSADMACHNYFSHTGLDGSDFSGRAVRQGYIMSGGAENIAAGYSNPAEVVRDWMNSPGHKANILGDYLDIGVGYAYGTGDYGAYWTAVFGSP